MEQRTSDLIDRDALKEAVNLKLPLTNYTTCKIIDAQPTVDAVAVVRCKDCKFVSYNEYLISYWCNKFKGRRNEDGYCSFGKDNA